MKNHNYISLIIKIINLKMNFNIYLFIKIAIELIL